MAPLPARPKPTPTTEHTELRPLGKPIARHVDRGFETLVVSTGEDMRCEGERLESGADVRIQGASDSAPAVVGMVFEPAGRQRRQQRRRRERRVARHPAAAARARRTPDRARLPSCRRATARPSIFVSRFPTPSRTPRIRARSRTGPTRFAHHVAGSAWGEFASGARARALSEARRRRRSPTRPIRATRDTARSSRRPPRRQRASAKAEGGVGQGNAGRNGARRAARDRAAARPVRAGAPDGHHDRDDVAAGDAADRSRLCSPRRTSPRRWRCPS